MPRVALVLINDFEETEAITSADILRRGNVDVDTVSLEKDSCVKGKHNILVQADISFDEMLKREYDLLLIPGGTTDYLNRSSFLEFVEGYYATGKQIAAICAAPAILGKLGLLEGKTAVCYPGMENHLTGAIIGTNNVETYERITTSKGPGTTIAFALRVLELLQGKQCAEEVAEAFLA